MTLLLGDGRDMLRMLNEKKWLWARDDPTAKITDLLVLVLCANKLFEKPSSIRKEIDGLVMAFLKNFRQAFYFSMKTVDRDEALP